MFKFSFAGLHVLALALLQQVAAMCRLSTSRPCLGSALPGFMYSHWLCDSKSQLRADFSHTSCRRRIFLRCYKASDSSLSRCPDRCRGLEAQPCLASVATAIAGRFRKELPEAPATLGGLPGSLPVHCRQWSFRLWRELKFPSVILSNLFAPKLHAQFWHVYLVKFHGVTPFARQALQTRFVCLADLWFWRSDFDQYVSSYALIHALHRSVDRIFV